MYVGVRATRDGDFAVAVPLGDGCNWVGFSSTRGPHRPQTVVGWLHSTSLKTSFNKRAAWFDLVNQPAVHGVGIILRLCE
jgi:hypothetical protein